MSFLRALPSLRSRAAHRAWAAPFSSTASTSANTTDASQKDIIDALRQGISDVSSTTSAASTIQSDARFEPELDVVEGPPVPSEDSYPPAVNPAAIANAAARAPVGSMKPLYAVSVKATRNNTIITFAREGGDQLVTLTGGKLGFKKSNRNGYEAGYQCAVGIIAAMEEEMKRTDFVWQLFLKGFGQGRDAMLTAITTAVGANVKGRLLRVTDRTPIKIGGTRGMKARRI